MTWFLALTIIFTVASYAAIVGCIAYGRSHMPVPTNELESRYVD